MSFEEQFPSLKGKIYDAIHVSYGSTVINLRDVEEHCLDKQKVKDKIEEIIDKNTAIILLQELGL